MSRANTGPLCFEDLEVGQEWPSPGRTVTEADIVNYAGLSGDFNAVHIDHEYAKTTPFRRPIAHGFLVFSMASGLGVSSPATNIVALLRVDEWHFREPTFIGDTIRVRTRVEEVTAKGRGRRAEVRWYRCILNQEDKVLQDGIVVTLVAGRMTVKDRPRDEEVAVSPKG